MGRNLYTPTTAHPRFAGGRLWAVDWLLVSHVIGVCVPTAKRIACGL